MSMLIPSFLVLLLFLYAIQSWIQRRNSSLPLPPGPTGSYISGVQKVLTPVKPWKQYFEWGMRYGNGSPIISFRVYNKRMVILNTAEAIHDLLDKRSSIYSDRPKSWMFHELCGRGKAVFNISSLDERHRQYRKLLASGLGERAVKSYWPLLEEEMETLVSSIERNPSGYEGHFRRNAAGAIMKVAYGYTVEENDFFVAVAEEAAKISGWALAPGRWLVDYVPILRHVPSWFPGAYFKRQGLEWHEKLESMSSVTHNWVKQQMELGSYTESFTSRLLKPVSSSGTSDVHESVTLTPDQDDIIKWCAGGLYVGAFDTTVSAMISFTLLMALHPEVQARAQKEIDDVVNLFQSDVPRPEQIQHFTYLAAILKEVLRYAPVANLALAHKVVKDDVYHGYRIPKNSTVIANVWAVMRNPILYPAPNTFNPERFVAGNSQEYNPDPRAYAFGFGRRTCPGQQFAETSLLLCMATVLFKFNISLPTMHDCEQDPSSIKVDFTTGITSHIKPFPISIQPRLRSAT